MSLQRRLMARGGKHIGTLGITMNKKIILGLVVLALFSGIILSSNFLEKQLGRTSTSPENYTSSTPPSSYRFSNDWLNKRNLYVYGTPPLEYLYGVGAAGVTWSVYRGGLNEYDEEYVDTLHQIGFKVASNFPTVQGNITENAVLREAANCVNLNGKTSIYYGDQYAMCYNNPIWQEFLGRITAKSNLLEEIYSFYLEQIKLRGEKNEKQMFGCFSYEYEKNENYIRPYVTQYMT